MTKTIAIADLNLGIIPQAVRDDALWLRCMALACRSRSEKQRYGAIVILNGQVVGEGWNRLLQKGEPFPFRTTFFLHAERAAIGQAIQHLGSLESIHGASVLVAGLLST
jgi:tRNA(Arg) A34 adenosine deaminase TadA